MEPHQQVESQAEYVVVMAASQDLDNWQISNYLCLNHLSVNSPILEIQP